MKICTKCKQEHPESNFVKSSKARDGLHCNCKDCTKKSQQLSYLRNRNEIKYKALKYYYDKKNLTNS
jgi:hypothetical protein